MITAVILMTNLGTRSVVLDLAVVLVTGKLAVKASKKETLTL